MTALLQASTASDPEAGPILLQVDRDTGHGMGTPTDKATLAVVDQISFLMWQLKVGEACGGVPSIH